MRSKFAFSILLVLALGRTAPAWAQVVADGRSGRTTGRVLETVRLPRDVVERALRSGGASQAALARVAGKTDSVEFTVEKPPPKRGRPGDRRPRWFPHEDETDGAPPTRSVLGKSPISNQGLLKSEVPVFLNSFAGPGFFDVAVENGYFVIPPDASVAASADHVVTVVNTSIAGYLKDGTPTIRESFQAFFGTLEPSGTLFDPRVRFSEFDGRFVVVILELTDDGAGAPTNRSNLLVAVSAGDDPRAGWTFSRIDLRTTVQSTVYWADYPAIAVDEEALYVTANLFAFGTGEYGGSRLWVVPLQDVAVGGTIVPTAIDPFAAADVPGLSSTLQVAAPIDASGGPEIWLVEYSGLNDGQYEYVGLFRLVMTAGSPDFELAFLELGDIDAVDRALPGAPQPASAAELATGDRRALDAARRGGRLAGTFTVRPPVGADEGQATAAWFEADVSNPISPSLAAFGTIGANEVSVGAHSFFPAVGLASDGSLAIGFSASAPDAYAGAYVAIRGPLGAVGTISEPVALQSGDGPYLRTFGGDLNRWGDYSGLAPDPSNDGSFWVFNQYAGMPGNPMGAEDGQWGTRIGRVVAGIPIPVNRAPEAEDLELVLDEDTPAEVALRATDPDADPLTFEIVNPPLHGGISLEAATARYLPTAEFAGPDVFTFRAGDGQAWSTPASVYVTVRPVNDPPSGVADAFSTIEERPLAVAAPGVLGNDTDPDAVPGELFATLVAAPVHGILALASNGSFTYEPISEFAGQDGFEYAVKDLAGGRGTARVTLTVAPVDDPPIARDNAYATAEDYPLSIPVPGVLSNDTDIDSSSLQAFLLAPPTHGTVTLHPSGAFDYTPNPGFSGWDSFTSEVRDASNASAAEVRILVMRTNDAPVAADDASATTEDTPLDIAAPGVLSNDRDEDSPVLSSAVLSPPRHGTVEMVADGGFRYVPQLDFAGNDAFEYTVSDGEGGLDTGLVSIRVDPANDVPIAIGGTARVESGMTVAIPLEGRDVDGDPLVFSLRALPSHGTASLSGSTATYVSEAGHAGSDLFTFVVSDGTTESNEARVDVDVIGTARLQTIHAGRAGSASIDVYLGGQTIVSDLSADSASPWSTVLAGAGDLVVMSARGGTELARLPLDVAHGAILQALVLAGSGVGTGLILVPDARETASGPGATLRVVNGSDETVRRVELVRDTPDHGLLLLLAADLEPGEASSWTILPVSVANVGVETSVGLEVLRFDLAVSTNGPVLLLVGPPEGTGSPPVRVFSGSGSSVRPARVTGAATADASGRFVVDGPFPNPSASTMILLVDGPRDAEIGVEVRDLLGRLVLEFGGRGAGAPVAMEIPTSGLAPGVYVARIRSADGGNEAAPPVSVRFVVVR